MRSPWAISGAIHAALALGYALSVYLPSIESELPLPIEVIEAPKEALSPLRALPMAQPKREEPARRQVFGASRKSHTDEASSVEVKAGNTVAKTPDTDRLRPEDEDQIPIPTEEYLVSRMPELLREVRAPYPPEARKKNIQGAVIFDLLIDARGKVRQAQLVQGVMPELDQAAYSAVMQFEFKPAVVEDKPVAVRIRYAYRFILEK